MVKLGSVLKWQQKDKLKVLLIQLPGMERSVGLKLEEQSRKRIVHLGRLNILNLSLYAQGQSSILILLIQKEYAG